MQSYTIEPHIPIPLKGTPYRYCRCCGLLYLRNTITQTCIRLGCNYESHIEYKKWRYSLKNNRSAK